MSARQLSKVFPKGDTIHVPSNGKPLKGYDTAMANLKRGRNADGSRRGSEVKQSLLARLFSRSDDDDDEGDEDTIAPTPARKPEPKASPYRWRRPNQNCRRPRPGPTCSPARLPP